LTRLLLSIIALWPVIATGQQRSPEAYLRAAREAEAAGDFAGAEKAYERSLGLQENGQVWERLGLVRHLQNKFAQAIPAFEKSIRLRPGGWSSHLFLGIAYYRTNQFSRALPSLVRALELKPGEPEARYWLGVTYLALKRYLEGLEILEQLSTEQTENTEINRLLAQTYSDYGVALLNRVAERHPRSAAAYHVHGLALENEGGLEAALREYETALSLEPRRAGVHQAIGRILWARGELDKAAAEFEKELAIQPQEPESNFYLGKYRLLTNDRERARRNLEVAFQWTSDSAEPAIALAGICLQLGDTVCAAEAARSAVALAPRSEEAHNLLISALEKAGDTGAVAGERARWSKISKK
jgi:tetratricopeptide (TPR) repeat protein